jgi:acylphosphatase
MATHQIRIIGRVQGVGFRYALHDEARRLGVRGWVRNCADSSVEALLQGDDDAVNALLAWARRGPRLARVEEVREQPVAPAVDRPYDSFEIWPSA